jgi:hypothetical protein
MKNSAELKIHIMEHIHLQRKGPGKQIMSRYGIVLDIYV